MKYFIHFCAKRFAVVSREDKKIISFDNVPFDGLPKFIKQNLDILEDDVISLPTLSNAKYNAYGLAVQHFIMMLAEMVGAQCVLVKPMTGADKQKIAVGSGKTLNAKVDKALLAKLPEDWPQDIALARAYHLFKQ